MTPFVAVAVGVLITDAAVGVDVSASVGVGENGVPLSMGTAVPIGVAVLLLGGGVMKIGVPKVGNGLGSNTCSTAKYHTVLVSGSFPHPTGPMYRCQIPWMVMPVPSGTSCIIDSMPIAFICSSSEIRPHSAIGPLNWMQSGGAMLVKSPVTRMR